MVASDFRDKYAIVGVGMTPTARSHAPGMKGKELEVWAARLALEDAGLRREDIDGAVHVTVAGFAGWNDTFSRELGLKPNFYMNASRGGQVSIAGIMLAMQALELEQSNYVILACGLPGWSEAHSEHRGVRGSVIGATREGGSTDFGLGRLMHGASAASSHGFYASRHRYEYGTTDEQFGAVALATRAWAQLNPEARFYGRPATMEDYLASPWVIWPVRRMDCCVQSDLGVSLIVTTAERARTLKHKPVYIKGIGIGDQAREQWWSKTNYTQTDAAHAKGKAFSMAGVNLADIDVAELYDCFTAELMFYLEDYGWCKKGEGGPFAASGAIAPGGSIPVNTHGGLLSGMYLFDLPNVVEAVRQLRGDAGQRQVQGAEIALTNAHGGEMLPPMCASHGCMVLGNVLS